MLCNHWFPLNLGSSSHTSWGSVRLGIRWLGGFHPRLTSQTGRTPKVGQKPSVFLGERTGSLNNSWYPGSLEFRIPDSFVWNSEAKGSQAIKLKKLHFFPGEITPVKPIYTLYRGSKSSINSPGSPPWWVSLHFKGLPPWWPWQRRIPP